MRIALIVTVVIISVGLAFAAGNADNGKKLFNDPTFAGSTNAKSCNTCHPDGRGLEQSGQKKYTSLMGIKASSLGDIVNICIVRPLEGKALSNDSDDMKDVVAYIKSLNK